ncbi:MAG: flagellar biosynthetic protein FliR [Melioribacteraceae bacterium]|nr:flagellar biosynthetic protein FliR [Melioribacteraceae bacterium]
MEILVTDFTLILLIFIRILSAFAATPIYSHESIPSQVKVFISFVIAFIVFSISDSANIAVDFNPWWLFVMAIKEVVVGLIIGFTLNLVFYGFTFAGTFIGFDMGLAMAQVMNPVEKTTGNVIGQVIYFLALMIFFMIDGHQYVIRALAYSFQVIPIGEFQSNEALFTLMIQYSSSVFIIAVKIAAPILVSFFLIHIAEGILARMIPQMQVFFVTQPLKIGIGFLLLMAILPVYFYVIKNLLSEFETKLYTLVRTMG